MAKDSAQDVIDYRARDDRYGDYGRFDEYSSFIGKDDPRRAGGPLSPEIPSAIAWDAINNADLNLDYDMFTDEDKLLWDDILANAPAERSPWTGEDAQSNELWDWSYFAPKGYDNDGWGGYDRNYEAFEQYAPSGDSPWGNPSANNGNQNFYQQQFANMLRNEQGFQSLQRESQEAQQAALDTPFEPIIADWSWANNGAGLPEIEMMDNGYAAPMAGINAGAENTGYQVRDASFTPRGSWGFN